MAQAGLVYLMYHELWLPGRSLCQEGKGYARYAVPEADFRRQLAWLRENRIRGLNVSEGLEHSEAGGPAIVITFDDGCNTDRLIAAPLLQEAGFHATFYVVAGFLGAGGYLAPLQLRELVDLGFEVGCHSMSHAYLPDLEAQGLRREIAEAKDRLEQIVGRSVDHFSCPGGRWSLRVVAQARAAGYRTVAASRVGTNSSRSDPYRLARVAILRGFGLEAFARVCRADGFSRLQIQAALKGAAQTVLGNSFYEKLRSGILERFQGER